MIKLSSVFLALVFVPQTALSQVTPMTRQPYEMQWIVPPIRSQVAERPPASPGTVEQASARECLEWWAAPACPPGLPALPPENQATVPPQQPEPLAPAPQSITQPFRPESMPSAPVSAMAPPAPSIASLSAGQGAITSSSYVAMMTGDLFGTGASSFTVVPESFTARGPAFGSRYQIFRDNDDNSTLNQPPDTGLPITGTGPNGGMQLHANGSSVFPTPRDFETILSRPDVNTAFRAGMSQFDLRPEPSLASELSTHLNGRPEYAPGQSYGGGVIAPGGPDFQSELTDLVAEYDDPPVQPGAPLAAPGQGIDPLPGIDNFFVLADFSSAPLVQYDPSPIVMTAIPGENLAAAPGGNVGRVKLAENTSPIPRDRIYVNYSYFDEARVTPKGASVNRVTPGFEKTFLDGNASIEFRAPFATTLDSTIVPGATLNTDSTEFGNISAYFKALLWNNDSFGISAGCGLAAPTADDFRVRDAATRNTILTVENESPHVLPFIGALYAPDDRLFAQGLLQLDFDTVGNPVNLSSYNQGAPTGDLTRIGRANDSSYMFLGGNIGYWIYQGSTPSLPFTGLSPFAEVYYNQSLTRGDRIQGTVTGTQFDSGPTNELQLVNAVVGMNATMHFGGMLTVAYATPVGGGNDRQYDGEVRVLYNVLFGPQNRFTRAQF